MFQIKCEFDANFQLADIKGRQGLEVRPLPQVQIGPVAWLYRCGFDTVYSQGFNTLRLKADYAILEVLLLTMICHLYIIYDNS